MANELSFLKPGVREIPLQLENVFAQHGYPPHRDPYWANWMMATQGTTPEQIREIRKRDCKPGFHRIVTK